MGKIIEAVVRNRNVITVPKEVINLLNVKEGDILAFKIEHDRIVLGVLEREIVKKEIRFTLKKRKSILLSKPKSD